MAPEDLAQQVALAGKVRYPYASTFVMGNPITT